ncbi:hypothetical protein RB195_013993 [Necator americanus]|uniref:Uncharacterized protein n=1 Tax=Necator americanus TaxID=51031 RepID=A0ABR1E0V2_NECAM
MMNDLTSELGRRKRMAWGAFKSIEDVVKRTKNIWLCAHLLSNTFFLLWPTPRKRGFRKQEENAISVIERGIEKEEDFSHAVSESYVGATNVPVAICSEGASPERPFVRPPNATAKELIEIHRNYRQGANQEWPVFLPPNMDEDLQNLEHPDPAKRPRYLPLAPPYHLLPNTSFFRRTSIKPPPTYSTDGLPPLKRIINRYLASILVDHMKFEESLRFLIEERKTYMRVEQTRKGDELKDSDDRESKTRTKLEEFMAEGGWKQYRKPWNGGNLPPPVPGYFTSVPLIPGNINVTREMNGRAPVEYQQQRTAHGFIYIPYCATEIYTERGPSVTDPPVTPLNMSFEGHQEQDHKSESDEETVNQEDTAQATFGVIATERYASFSLTADTMSMKFTEKCVSLCRSPKHG